jgi:hypothetical protein
VVKKRKSSSGDSARSKPWVDPDDGPEITDELLDRAVLRHGDTIIRRGRPPLNVEQDGAPKPRKT